MSQPNQEFYNIMYGTHHPLTLKIGDAYQGGLVAYIFDQNDPGYSSTIQHGLIMDPDITVPSGGSIFWYNGSYSVTGATQTAIGTGNYNTNLIVAAQGSGTYSAKICYDLNKNGYSDWYLPSIDELYKIYLNYQSLGGTLHFLNAVYWSSSELNSTRARSMIFQPDLLPGDTQKNQYNGAFAIRSF